jgi:hypothetical protein
LVAGFGEDVAGQVIGPTQGFAEAAVGSIVFMFLCAPYLPYFNSRGQKARNSLKLP